MGIKDQAKKIAAGAGVAIATTGLSNCNDNGAVDPPPPPLQCNTVNMGQSLSAGATRSGDTIDVTVRNTHAFASWRVDRVVAGNGVTVISTRLPAARTADSLGVQLRLSSAATTQASFAVEATLFGLESDECAMQRTFNLTISSGGVQVSLSDSDRLPLAARQHAEILLARQEGHVVELHARTAFQGKQHVRWAVSQGELDTNDRAEVRWTLPGDRGIYQIELVIDFGDDGLAFDTLTLEVL